MDRERLARLLDRVDAAFQACRQAVLGGAPFVVYGEATPVDQLVTIYTRRERHTRRAGIAALGFANAVTRLAASECERVRLGTVTVDDPLYHFQLFFDEDAATVIACLGVDQHPM